MSLYVIYFKGKDDKMERQVTNIGEAKKLLNLDPEAYAYIQYYDVEYNPLNKKKIKRDTEE